MAKQIKKSEEDSSKKPVETAKVNIDSTKEPPTPVSGNTPGPPNPPPPPHRGSNPKQPRPGKNKD